MEVAFPFIARVNTIIMNNPTNCLIHWTLYVRSMRAWKYHEMIDERSSSSILRKTISHWSSEGCGFDPRLELRNGFSEDRAWRSFIHHLMFNSFIDRPVIQDVAYAGAHSFISQECSTVTKYHVKGKYAFLLRHNISRMFPKAKSVIESSFYNVKFTRKKLESEQNIFKVCATIN